MRIPHLRWQVMWKWGPVISYKLRLEEIDSASESLHDVMELCLMPDAQKSAPLHTALGHVACPRHHTQLVTRGMPSSPHTLGDTWRASTPVPPLVPRGRYAGDAPR